MFRLFLAAAPAALLAFSSASAEPVAYEFDRSHTVVSASWDHQGYSRQSLQFTDYDGTLDLDLETPANSTVDITFNGQTHPVSLDVTLNNSGETRDGRSKLGFTATGMLVRSQWDMGYAVPYVSDEIELFISTEMAVPAPAE